MGKIQPSDDTLSRGDMGSVVMAGVRLIGSANSCDDVSLPTPGMPLRAALIPDCTKPEAHHAAYRSARTNGAIFVCVARQGRRWKVELDALASSKPIVPHQVATVLQSAAEQLVSAGTVASGATVGPDSSPCGRSRVTRGHARARLRSTLPCTAPVRQCPGCRNEMGWSGAREACTANAGSARCRS